MIPSGCWRIRTLSDDGIRVRVDGKPVIDRWNWHPPTEDSWQLAVDRETTIALEVDWFEIDGNACLQLWVEPCEPVRVEK